MALSFSSRSVCRSHILPSMCAFMSRDIYCYDILLLFVCLFSPMLNVLLAWLMLVLLLGHCCLLFGLFIHLERGILRCFVLLRYYCSGQLMSLTQNHFLSAQSTDQTALQFIEATLIFRAKETSQHITVVPIMMVALSFLSAEVASFLYPIASHQ